MNTTTASSLCSSLTQQINFITELEKLKAVRRKALVKADDNRYETSAEHSWHITLAARVLAPYAEGEVDIERVCQMLLIHDVVEIDAGDTFAFAHHQVLDQQAAKERAAAQRLFGLLPQPQSAYYHALWCEFDEGNSADAQFAIAIDRIMPLIQNMQNEGGSWAQNQVSKQQVLQRNKYLEKSAPRLWAYALEQIDLATQKAWLRPE